jgi:anion-transporting  ArsA/GET3 family ATPase
MTTLVVCCGLGGVGKTTTAAALGVAYARVGKRVVVMTIDPARRLADALGTEAIGNLPVRVPLPDVPGTLDALMLDRDATWAEVIRRHAPSTDLADRLIANPWSRAVSSRLSGAHELMATEKLHALATDGRWDVVVVDTPPSFHALDFLHAPDRVRRLLDRRLLGALFEPASKGLVGIATRGLASLVRRVAGEAVMDDLSEFFGMVSALSTGLRERGAAVATLLHSRDCHYILVASAAAPREEEVSEFLAALRADGRSFSGSVLTRATAPLPVPVNAMLAELPKRPKGVDAAGWAHALSALVEAAATHERRAARDAATATRMARMSGAPVWPVPEVDTDSGAIAALGQIAATLPVL